jgi:single-stranded-DNA-specific exonuclease
MWKLRNALDETAVARLSAEARIPLVTAQLLQSRGIRTAAEADTFLNPALAQLHSPYEMLGMAAAVERACAAVERREKILIYGDYDVDGTLAIVILKTVIELSGGVCEFHVPHRIHEGYGMKDDVIERAAASGVRLVISVDTGIRAFTAAETASRVGLDLIVTDHHLPQAEGVPKAMAVLNPNQAGCTYPCKDLCGAGVAFKLAQALLEKTGMTRLVPSFLKLVAIATVADAVPLLGENRVFASLGLEGLRHPVNAGLKALMEVAQINHGRALTAGEVAFRLAPRMNAAGRMDVARDVIELFSTHNAAQARELAVRLNSLNVERQQEEQRILQEIETRITSEVSIRDAWCMVVDGDRWHKGVIGIAASRLVDRFCRPALVITRDGPEAQGSARSIPAFHMLAALESCAGLFSRFGGHAYAAGFALPSERIGALRAALDARARACLQPEDLQRVLYYDAEVSLAEITPAIFAEIQRLQPYGMGNPEPVFVARHLRLTALPRVIKEKHMKLAVRERETRTGTRSFQAMGWRMAERLQLEPLSAQDEMDLAFKVVENSHPDFGGLELSICDFAKNSKQEATASSPEQ